MSLDHLVELVIISSSSSFIKRLLKWAHMPSLSRLNTDLKHWKIVLDNIDSMPALKSLRDSYNLSSCIQKKIFYIDRAAKKVVANFETCGANYLYDYHIKELEDIGRSLGEMLGTMTLSIEVSKNLN